MKILGLTGGIGMGKSACAQLLRQRQIPVIDTDDLARQVVEPGQPALLEIQRAFGREVLAVDGRLRRDELARRVFSNSAARRRLEQILHPRIREMWHSQAAAWRQTGHALGIVVIPLLFETQAEKEVDLTMCVACSQDTQQQRLLERGWSADQIEQRLRAQWPIEKKIALSDYVVWTEGSIEIHAQQLERVVSRTHALLKS